MVCIPCIVVPFLLFIYHKFLQPYVMMFWRMWNGKPIMGPEADSGAKCPFQATAPIVTEEAITLTEITEEMCRNIKPQTCETTDHKKDD